MDRLIVGMKKPPSRRDPRDSEWIGKLYDRHARSVYGYALRVLGRTDAAEDVVAETFLRACRSRAGFRGESEPLTWLIRIASRVCLDVVARLGPKTPPPAEHVGGPGLSPMEADERNALLARAMARLPLAQREVVVLKQFVGLTFREIADSVDAPLGTVLGRMHRAVRKLAEAPELKRWMNE